jgi:hypothetical protein
METLAGFPDFQAPISTAGLLMYAPFGTGRYSVLPRQMNLATESNGKPKFQLNLIKRAGDPNPAGQYAAFDLALAGDFPLDEALAIARAKDEEATVKPIDINSGFARLYPTGSTVALPSDMLAPTALDWSGSDFVRWRMRLSVDAGELIKGALSNGALLFGASVEFEVIGVTPRAAVTVQFRPAQLIAALLAGKENRQVSHGDLMAFFASPIDTIPLRIIGSLEPADAGWFPQAMADRIVAAFGSAVPAPAHSDPSAIVLADPDQLETATVDWDLSQAAAAPRQFVMALDPLGSLRAATESGGIDGLVKEIAIPPLDLGFRSVSLAANLPASRVGVPAIGVNIQVPPNPPIRPNGISETVAFTPPDDEAVVDFRLSPAESFLYTLSTFAVVNAGRSVQEYTGPSRQLDATWVQLQASDFPVTFAHLTAVGRLTDLATVTGTLSYKVSGQTVEQPFTLSAEASDVAMAFPTNASDALITITAVPNDGSPTLALLPLTPGRFRFDVTSFREYGPHVLTIQCSFVTETGFLAIDLLPEEKSGDDTAASTFMCTAAEPKGTWGYTTSSPFRSGYRYRKSAVGSNQPGPWSDVLSPFTPLMLREDGA